MRWDDPTEIVIEPEGVTLARGALRARVDRTHGTVTQVYAIGHADGLLAEPIGALSLTRDGRVERFEVVDVRWGRDDLGAYVRVERSDREGHTIALTVRLAPRATPSTWSGGATGCRGPMAALRRRWRRAIGYAMPKRRSSTITRTASRRSRRADGTRESTRRVTG